MALNGAKVTAYFGNKKWRAKLITSCTPFFT